MKKITVCLIAGLLLLGLAGCTNVNEGNVMMTPSPSMAPIIGTPTPLPGVNASPGMLTTGMPPTTTEPPTAPTLSNQESAALAKQCDTQIMKLSEVDQSVTVLSGNRVLSGITFTPQYKGNMTERIEGMVAERVKTVAPSVQVALVTADADTVEQIAALKEKQQNGTDIGTEFDTIEKNLKSGQ